jgi:hypothetical protein
MVVRATPARSTAACRPCRTRTPAHRRP